VTGVAADNDISTQAGCAQPQHCLLNHDRSERDRNGSSVLGPALAIRMPAMLG
jgi:hypothetical protein